MAGSPSLPFSILLLISYFLPLLTFTSPTSIPLPTSSSSIASRQFKIWSTNVINDMPNAIISKLSPLSIHDSDYFTQLVSDPSFVSDPNFCSLANLACAPNLNTIKPLSNSYSTYQNNKQNPNTIKPLSNAYSDYQNNKQNLNTIKPLSNSYSDYQNNKQNPNTIKPLSNSYSDYQNNKQNPNTIKPLSNAYSDYQNNKQNLNTIKPLSNAYSNYQNNKQKHTADSADPFSFFRLSVLKQGKTVHLPDLQDTSPFRAFLPSQIASKFSLTSNKVLKRVFPNSFVSPITVDAIERTFGYCNAPTMKGEAKSCVKSLEEMIAFSKKWLGVKKLVSLTSKSIEGSGKELLVGNVKLYDDTKKIVSCHEVYLPFSTYFCHLISSSRLFAVELLEPETRVMVNKVVAVCHMDTSEWPANHVSFRLLKLTPGKGEACHWFSQVDLAWIGA